MSKKTQAGGIDRALRLLLILSTLLPTALLAGAALYDFALEKHETDLQLVATADALAEHAVKLLEIDDLVLARVADRIAPLRWDQVGTDAALHDFLVRLKNELPQVESVFIVDADDRNIASSRSFPFPPFDVHGRDYVQAARAHPGALFVSAPFAGLYAGDTAFVVTRPLTVGNAYAGLVGVTMSPRYFQDFYHSIAGKFADATASLMRADGEILARYPPEGEGTARHNTPLSQAIARKPMQGISAGFARIDGIWRRGAYQRLPDQPLYVYFGVGRQEYIGRWYRHVAAFAGLALLSAATLAYTTRLALLRTRAERTSTARLLAEVERRERAETTVLHLQKMESLGRLTGGIAHDFNNLLTAVLGALELALRRDPEPSMRRLLEASMQAARRGARLTAQMLAFSRQRPMLLQPVDVAALLAGQADMLATLLRPDIELASHIADDLWPALTDPAQFETAVLNLAINARDAMPEGGRVDITARNLPGEQDRVLVEVRDTGTGMSDAVRSMAFDPFFTTKDPGKGTGLGLSMVYAFARQAGGTAEIESALGRGTAVRIILPRARAAPEAAAPAAPELPRGTRLSVLLVDDDADARGLAAEMLRSFGHLVSEQPGADAALAALAGGLEPDIAILDMAMPVMRGDELARRIRQRSPDMPILFITGYTEGDGLETWLAAGHRSLAKPFTLADLDAALRATLAQARAA